MTADRVVDAVATSAVAGATTAGALMGMDLTGWVVPVVSAGLAALVGYFTARATTEREIGVAVERESNHFDEIMRRLDRIDKKLDNL